MTTISKEKFMSDITYLSYMYQNNLPVNKQDIDEIEEEHEPDNGDEKFHDDDFRQDDNPNENENI